MKKRGREATRKAWGSGGHRAVYDVLMLSEVVRRMWAGMLEEEVVR